MLALSLQSVSFVLIAGVSRCLGDSVVGHDPRYCIRRRDDSSGSKLAVIYGEAMHGFTHEAATGQQTIWQSSSRTHLFVRRAEPAIRPRIPPETYDLQLPHKRENRRLEARPTKRNSLVRDTDYLSKWIECVNGTAFSGSNLSEICGSSALPEMTVNGKLHS